MVSWNCSFSSKTTLNSSEVTFFGTRIRGTRFEAADYVITIKNKASYLSDFVAREG